MDTIEHSVQRGPFGLQIANPPIIWKDKTAREVQREKYPDHHFWAHKPAPKSTRAGIYYPKSFTGAPFPEEKPRDMTPGEVLVTFVEIEK